MENRSRRNGGRLGEVVATGLSSIAVYMKMIYKLNLTPQWKHMKGHIYQLHKRYEDISDHRSYTNSLSKL